MKTVNATSTKAELFAAYSEMKKQLEEQKTPVPNAPSATMQTATVSIQRSIATLIGMKSSIDTAVSTLEQQRQNQIVDEQRAQAELTKFQEDMKRAKEEFDYEIKRMRQQKVDSLEQELSAKHRSHDEAILQEKQVLQLKKEELEKQDDDLKQLRKQAEAFPAELERQLKKAADATRAEEQGKAKVARDLTEKQAEGEQAVMNLKIITLEKMVKDQAEEIRALKSQLEQATRQVKDIAVSVIESRRPVANESKTATSN